MDIVKPLALPLRRGSRRATCAASAPSCILLPVATRMPLQFGTETLRAVTCAGPRRRRRPRWAHRRRLGRNAAQRRVGLAQPDSHATRRQRMIRLLRQARAGPAQVRPLGPSDRSRRRLSATTCCRALIAEFNADRRRGEQLPRLAALVCCSPFDLALHDAYGRLHGVPVYETYDPRVHEPRPGGCSATTAAAATTSAGSIPPISRVAARAQLPAWHLVGGLDPLDAADLTGAEPDDGYPVLLRDWIDRDGLHCLKIKLRRQRRRVGLRAAGAASAEIARRARRRSG